jgi:hypothetical protein
MKLSMEIWSGGDSTVRCWSKIMSTETTPSDSEGLKPSQAKPIVFMESAHRKVRFDPPVIATTLHWHQFLNGLPVDGAMDEPLPSLTRAPVQQSDDDEALSDAWNDFAGTHLEDGNGGHRAADVYRTCRAAFDAAAPQGHVEARAAAVAALAEIDGRAALALPQSAEAGGVEAAKALVSEDAIYLTGAEKDKDEAAIFVTVADVRRLRAALDRLPAAGEGQSSSNPYDLVTDAMLAAAKRYVRGEDDAIRWAIEAALSAAPAPAPEGYNNSKENQEDG